MPIYTGDYLRDTRHLTPQKHGVYLLLLMHCWDQKGPLPLDEQECAGIANCRSSDEIEAIRYILGKYFVRMDDGWYNTRMQHEIERSEVISMARSSAGRKGYEAKAKQLLSSIWFNGYQRLQMNVFRQTRLSYWAVAVAKGIKCLNCKSQYF